MSSTLAAKSCTPCRGGVPPLTSEEATRYLAQAPQTKKIKGPHENDFILAAKLDGLSAS